MKSVVVWRLHQQEAFDRAMELQFGLVPKKDELIKTFRQRLLEGIATAAARKPADAATEHTVKYTLQRYPYQKHGEPAPPVGLKEEWLEVRYRIVDDGTAEIVSVTSPTLPL